MSRKVMKEMADQMAAIGEDKPVNDITMNVRLMFFFYSRGKMAFYETIENFCCKFYKRVEFQKKSSCHDKLLFLEIFQFSFQITND